VIGVDPGRVNIMTCCVHLMETPTPRDIGVDRSGLVHDAKLRPILRGRKGVDALAIKTKPGS
jgi:hypothetical protein